MARAHLVSQLWPDAALEPFAYAFIILHETVGRHRCIRGANGHAIVVEDEHAFHCRVREVTIVNAKLERQSVLVVMPVELVH